MTDAITILTLAGSLRRDSYNRVLARAAVELAPTAPPSKPAAVMGASPGAGGARAGRVGGANASRTRSQVLDRTVSVPVALQALDDEPVLIDSGVRHEIAGLAAELAEHARRTEPIAA